MYWCVVVLVRWAGSEVTLISLIFAESDKASYIGKQWKERAKRLAFASFPYKTWSLKASLFPFLSASSSHFYLSFIPFPFLPLLLIFPVWCHLHVFTSTYVLIPFSLFLWLCKGACTTHIWRCPWIASMKSDKSYTHTHLSLYNILVPHRLPLVQGRLESLPWLPVPLYLSPYVTRWLIVWLSIISTRLFGSGVWPFT